MQVLNGGAEVEVYTSSIYCAVYLVVGVLSVVVSVAEVFGLQEALTVSRVT